MRKPVLFAVALLVITGVALAASLGLDGSSWKVLYSKNCPANPSTVTVNGSKAWLLKLRNDCQPHYVLRGASDSMRAAIKDSGSSLMVTMQVANAALKSVQHGGSNTYATVMLQRQGDDLSGSGKYEFYRLWAGGYRIKLVNGVYTVTIPMDRTKWTGVFGKNPSDTAMKDTLANLNRIGVTMGGASDFGHGVKGTADIYMLGFTVN